jgi:hypothetical protein
LTTSRSEDSGRSVTSGVDPRINGPAVVEHSEVRDEVVAVDLEPCSHFAENGCQRSDSQSIVPGNSDVMLAAVRGHAQPDVAPDLAL